MPLRVNQPAASLLHRCGDDRGDQAGRAAHLPPALDLLDGLPEDDRPRGRRVARREAVGRGRPCPVLRTT
jgi:hypothetical protein